MKTYRNVLFVFLCSGLWHGANVTFVCWGLLYGMFIVLENMGLKKFLNKHRFISHIYLLSLVVSAWVIFRADNMGYAKDFLARMWIIDFNSLNITYEITNNILFAILTGIVLSYDWRRQYCNVVRKVAVQGLNYHKVFLGAKIVSFISALVLFVLSISSIVSSSHNPFIYFRF